MNQIIVIGIGNPLRGDDGVGCAVIDAIQEKVNGNIKLYKMRGDILELMDFFAHHSIVYLIDACLGSAPGCWQRMDARRQIIDLEPTPASTHALTIPQIIALAQTLDQLPSQLIIYAIQGDQFQIGSTLSAPVVRAVDIVAQNILEEIQPCMKKA